ncbi:MAG TPA: Gfo/Idh/MocA family oxidoreductase [Candidatus Dormibacteraeota bacterium]|nr:Gfo/Idh/MocA family oxidoreductase [Candidatus Dormibacteraeota bacterium]
MDAGTTLDRRGFLQRGLTLGGVAVLSSCFPAEAQADRPAGGSRFSAAIIGHTGRGDYGHGLDVIFNGHPDVEVRAVADPDPTGRAQAQTRCHAPRSYAEYGELLATERPQLVAVGPRHTDQHHAIVAAVLRSGAHVIVEKPFTQTLAEADELNALAQKSNLQIVVAHQLRLAPSIQHLKRKLEEGLIGRLVAIQAHGKQDDRRAGGEDMIVLGTHLFDLMRYLAGDVASATAQIWQRGREVMKSDAHAASEAIGPVLGDEIEAQFQFRNGVTGAFTSRARLRETLGPWGLTLLGDQGVVRILWEIDPRILLRQNAAWKAEAGTERWIPLAGDPGPSLPADQRGFPAANRRVLEDWLGAIRERRPPACSGVDGAKALEMALGVFQAGLERARVPFPLVRRKHPLVTEI